MAGILLAVGAVLDWSTLSIGGARISRTGLDSGGGGEITGLLGALLLGATAVRLGHRTSRTLGPLALGIGVFACGLITLDLVNLSAPVPTSGEAAVTTIGPGIWVAALGALTAVAGGIALVIDDRGVRSRGVRPRRR